MQAYNISMHVLTIAIYFGSGTLKHADLGQFAIVLPAMLVPSVIGARVYQRFSDRSFTQAVMVALLFSGVALIVGAVGARR